MASLRFKNFRGMNLYIQNIEDAALFALTFLIFTNSYQLCKNSKKISRLFLQTNDFFYKTLVVNLNNCLCLEHGVEIRELEGIKEGDYIEITIKKLEKGQKNDAGSNES